MKDLTGPAELGRWGCDCGITPTDFGQKPNAREGNVDSIAGPVYAAYQHRQRANVIDGAL